MKVYSLADYDTRLCLQPDDGSRLRLKSIEIPDEFYARYTAAVAEWKAIEAQWARLCDQREATGL